MIVFSVLCLVWLFDQPLPQPATHTSFSANKAWCAVSDLEKSVTRVHRVSNGRPADARWQIAGWHRHIDVSDDGEYLVIGYDGWNLLPRDYDKDMIMLSIYCKGHLVRAIRLRELIRRFWRLRRTVSHYHWGTFSGFDGRGGYLVETVEGRLVFDLATGRRPDQSSQTGRWLGIP